MNFFSKLYFLCVFICFSFFLGCFNDDTTNEIHTDLRNSTPTSGVTPEVTNAPTDTPSITMTPTSTPVITIEPTPVGKTIVVVEDSDNDPQDALEAKATRNPGALRPGSVEDMVNQILNNLNPGECIKELKIIGHGKPGHISVGDGTITESGKYIDGNRSEWEPHLQKLKDKLCKDAKIILLGCNVGACDKGAAKLKELADFFGVPVEAPTGKVYGNCTEEEGSEHQLATPTGDKPDCINSPSDKKKIADKDKPLPTQIPPFDIGSVTNIALQPVELGMTSPENALIQYDDPVEIQSFLSGIDFSSYKPVEWLLAVYNYYVFIEINDDENIEYIICSDYDYFLKENNFSEVYEITWYLKQQLRDAYNPY